MPFLIGVLAIVAFIKFDQADFDKTVKGIEQVSGALTEGPIKAVTNAWIEVAFIAAGLGFGIWLVEAKVGKKQGYDVRPPTVEPIHVAQPPVFGASSGAGVDKGPFRISQGVSANASPGAGVFRRGGRVPAYRRAQPTRWYRKAA